MERRRPSPRSSRPIISIEGAILDGNRHVHLPGGDDIAALDCLNAGPSARLAELAAAGLTLPQPQLFASRTPYELSIVPYSYGLVDNEEVRRICGI